MKYFSINNSLNLKVLGHYPQTKDIHYNCHVWDEPKFVQHVHFTKIDFEPITANAILHPKSKQTDLINANSAMGFSNKLLISGKLKKLLEENRESGMQFFKSPIIQNGVEYEDYWLLNMYEFNRDYVDFEKSGISVDIIKKEGGTERIEIKINSLEEFLNIIEKHKEKMEIVSISNIYLKENITNNFFLLKNGIKYVVSEKLKKEIEDAGCTGIEFQPVELSYQEWTAPGGEREKAYGKL